MKTVVYEPHPGKSRTGFLKIHNGFMERYPSGGARILNDNAVPVDGDIVLDYTTCPENALGKYGLKFGKFVGGCAKEVVSSS